MVPSPGTEYERTWISEAGNKLLAAIGVSVASAGTENAVRKVDGSRGGILSYKLIDCLDSRRIKE